MELAGTLLTILTPLVAVPLTVITFYLRSLREHQVSRHADLARRVEAAESNLSELRRMLAEFERDYTTKEEWLRECMLARRSLEHLNEAAVRTDTTVGELRRCMRWRPTGPGNEAVLAEDRPCPGDHKRHRAEDID
jgi:hypothetical protein